MSTIRSRSPRYKRDYSFSSLSSGSFDNARTASYSQKSKSHKDHTKDNRRNDKKFSRRYSQERRLDNKVPRYDSRLPEQSTLDKEHSRNSKDQHYDSPEESYLEPVSSLHNTALILDKQVHQVGHNDIEESLRDPSTCNFRGVLSMSENEDIDREVLIDERKTDKGDTSNRIDRLERLVELLAKNTKTSHSQPNQATSSQESNWMTSSGNLFELIPRNSNFTTSMWLNKIQEECIERNFDEKTTIQFMQSKMTGVIKAWFKTVSSYDFTWPELKMLITETFPDNVDFAATLRLLLERTKKPDETITQYYFSKMYLLEACKISGANAVSCLIEGLGNEFWKREAKSQNFLTPESLYSQFLSKCTDYEEAEEYGSYQQKPQEFVDTFRGNTENRVENKFIRNDKYNYKNKKCFTCNKFGHLTIDCRHAPICYRCKNKGHIAVNCPLKKVNHE